MSTAVFSFGRFNPPTSGHLMLANRVADVAKKASADAFIFTGQTTDSKRNPLDYNKKTKYMKKAFKKVEVVKNSRSKTLFNALEYLDRKGYENIKLVVGSDRVPEFKKLIPRYMKDYNFKDLEIVSAGERDPDAEGVKGMSASKMRAAVARNDYDSFKLGCPETLTKRDCQQMFNDLKSGMNIKEDTEITEENWFNHDEFEVFCERVVSLQTRKKMARVARKTSKRRARARKRKEKFRKSDDKLKTLANKKAKMLLRGKLIGDKDWSSMSIASREKVDQLLQKKAKAVQKIAKKMYPKVKKQERERLQKLRAPEVEPTNEVKIVDRLVSQLTAKGMDNNKAHAVARSQLQKHGILKKGSEELTDKGKKRNSMTAGERAKDRAAKKDGKSPKDYKYNKKTNIATQKEETMNESDEKPLLKWMETFRSELKKAGSSYAKVDPVDALKLYYRGVNPKQAVATLKKGNKLKESFEFQFSDKETAQEFMREISQKRLGSSTGTKDGKVRTEGPSQAGVGSPTRAHQQMAKIMKKHGGKLLRTDEGPRMKKVFKENPEYDPEMGEMNIGEMSAKAHYAKMKRGGRGKGFVVSTPIDRERYPNRERQGLEGPYKSRKSGKIFYYDKRAGKYYDPDSDMYLQVSDVMESERDLSEWWQKQVNPKSKGWKTGEVKVPFKTYTSGGASKKFKKGDKLFYHAMKLDKYKVVIAATSVSDSGSYFSIHPDRLGLKGFVSATGTLKDHVELDECWDSHVQQGYKMKNGKRVPNCVPKGQVSEATSQTVHVNTNRAGYRKLEAMIASLDGYKESEFEKEGKAVFRFDAKKHDSAERKKVAEFIKKVKGVKFSHSIKEDLQEAPKDDRTQIAKQVKKFVKPYVTGKISVTSGKGKFPYIQVRAVGGEISNKLRKMVITKAMPKASVKNMDDISYGNVTKNYIAVGSGDWAKVMGIEEDMYDTSPVDPKKKMKDVKNPIKGYPYNEDTFKKKAVRDAKAKHDPKIAALKKRIADIQSKLDAKKGAAASVAKSSANLDSLKARHADARKRREEAERKVKASQERLAALRAKLKKEDVDLDNFELEERDYKKEYANFHGKPEQRAKRSKRVLARREMIKSGKAKKGDGKDVDHKDGNANNNSPSNLRMMSVAKNRSRNNNKQHEENGAGDEGTPDLVKKYKKGTPGQE